MAEEKITLNLNIKSKGVAGTVREMRRFEGSIEDIREELKRLASQSQGYNNKTRHGIAVLRKEYEALAQQIQKTGQKITGLSANVGTSNPGLKVTGTGSRLNASRQADLAAKLAERNRKAQLAQEQRDARRAAAEANRLRRIQEVRAAKQQSEAQNATRAKIGTVGFLGLNFAQQFAGLLDPVRIAGSLAPNISKITETIGSMFGSTIGSIVGELGNAVGKLLEGAIELGIGYVRSIVKGLAGIMTGIFTGLITASIGGISNIFFGLIGGALSGLVSVMTEALSTLTTVLSLTIDALASIVNAGLKAVVAVVQGFGQVLKKVWDGIWEGAKAVVQFSMETITSIIDFSMNQAAKGFEDFAKSQRDAMKGFAQIADTFKGTFEQGVESVRNLTNSLRTDYGLDQAQAASGAYFALSSNFRSTAEAAEVLRSSAKLATVAGEDFNEVARATANVINAYGMSAADADEVTKQLFGGVAVGAFELGEFIEGLGNTVGSAAAANVELKDLVGAFSALSVSGINAFKAGSGLNRIFETLLTPTAQSEKAIAKYNIRVKEFRAGIIDLPELLADVANKIPEEELREIFPTAQARRAFLGLTNNLDRFRKIIQDSQAAGGQLDQRFKELRGSITFIFSQMVQIGKVVRENLIAPFAKALIPVLNDVADIFKNIQSYVETLDFSDIAESFGEGVRAIFKNIVSMVIAFDKAFNIVESLKMGFGFILDLVKNISNVLSDPNTYMGIIRTIKIGIAGFQLIGQIIKDSFANPEVFAQNINIMMTSIAEGFKSVGTFLLDTLKDVFSIAIDFFVISFGAQLKDSVDGVITSLVNGLSGFLNTSSRNILSSIKSDSELGGASPENIAKRTLGEALGLLGSTLGGFRREPKFENTEQQRQSSFSAINELLNNISKAQGLNVAAGAGIGGNNQIGNLSQSYLNSIFLDALKTSSNLDEAMNKFLLALNQTSARPTTLTDQISQETVFRDMFENLAKSIYEGGIINKDDPELNNKLKEAGSVARVESDKISANQNLNKNLAVFNSNLSQRFDTLKDALGANVSGMSKAFKEGNSQAFNKFGESVVSINQEMNNLMESMKTAQNANTDAIKENTTVLKGKGGSNGAKQYETLYRLISTSANVNSSISGLRQTNPSAQVNRTGTVLTANGSMAIVEIKVPKDVLNPQTQELKEKEAKKTDDKKDQLELQKQSNEHLKIAADGITQMISNLESIDSKIGLTPDSINRVERVLESNGNKSFLSVFEGN